MFIPRSHKIAAKINEAAESTPLNNENNGATLVDKRQENAERVARPAEANHGVRSGGGGTPGAAIFGRSRWPAHAHCTESIVASDAPERRFASDCLAVFSVVLSVSTSQS